MFRRLIMFALGMVVGLSIGHALGYQHAKLDDQLEFMILRNSIKTVPKQY